MNQAVQIEIIVILHIWLPYIRVHTSYILTTQFLIMQELSEQNLLTFLLRVCVK
jgi:hypothetical protein